METNSRLCKPAGDLTIFEAAEFKASLLEVLANEGLVCLDLSQVKHVDTSVIQLMWAARKLGRVLVTNIPKDLDSKMAQLGFTEPLSE